MRGTKAPILDRALEKIEYEPNTGCWLWAGNIDDHGYGRIQRGAHPDDAADWGSYPLAHRVTYIKLKGLIPRELELDHLCRVRCCVNPAHLEPVLHRVNNLRGVSIMAENARKTACDRGHPYVEGSFANYNKDGAPHRKCLICNKMTCLDYYYRRTGRPHLSPLVKWEAENSRVTP